MKINLLFLLLLCTISLFANPIEDGALTSEERTFLINYLGETEQYVLQMLEDVDAKAWNHTVASEKWTIGECAEHILLTEAGIYQTFLEKTKSEKPNQTKKSAVADNDEIIQVLNDRITKRSKTINHFQPKGNLESKEAFIQAFRSSRKKVEELVAETKLPLHWYFVETPIGEIDLYQHLLILAAHASRHTQQIEDIKASLGLETTMIEFGGRTKINIATAERENTRRLFEEVLHLNFQTLKDNVDRVNFDGGGFVTFVYLEDESRLLPEAMQWNAMWAGLGVPSAHFESVKRRLKAFGVKELYPDKDQSVHFYFHAPGGQVYRLERLTEPKT